MRSPLLVLLLALLPPLPSLASPAAIATAETAITTGRAEEAFFALEAAAPRGKKEKERYAELLLEAAELLLQAEDAVFALQLGKKALVHRPKRLDARLLCLRAALEAESLDEADIHLVVLETARPEDPELVLWRARLSAADAEWELVARAAKRVPTMKAATAEQKAEAKMLARRAYVATEGEKKKLEALREEEAAAARGQGDPD